MELKARVKLDNLLFFSALTLYIFRRFIDSTLYSGFLPGGWTRLANGAVLAILVVKWLIDEEFTIKKLIIWICVFVLLALIAILNNYLNIFVLFALVLSAQDIEFDDILKCILLNLCILSLFIIVSCGLGILEDYTYEHSIMSFASEAHSLGFNYYSTLGYIAMTITAIYLYFNRQCGYIRLILLAMVNALFFLVHTTTLALAFSLLIIVAYIVVVKWKWFKFEKKIWDYIGILLPVFFSVFTIGTVFIYARGDLKIDLPILGTIVSRLDYSLQAIEEYGIHLFGENVEMYGNTAYYYGEAESGFYIDSGYMYMLIAYGIIISIIVIVFYMLIFHYVYLQHDAYVYAWLALLLGICCINNFVFNIMYNPLLLLLPKALYEAYKGKAKGLAMNTDKTAEYQAT